MSTAILFTIILGLVGVVIAIIFIVRKNQLAKNASGLDSWLDDPSSFQAADNEIREKWQICPTCGMKLPKDALFCPNDRTSLAPDKSEPETESNSQPTSSNIGMVCPSCHRGYEPGSKFCPHDSEPLIPYPEWRETNRT